MKKGCVYFAMASSFVLGSFPALAEPDSQHGQMHGQMEEQMFKEADTNSDGAISKAEFNAFQSRYFKKMDTNGDGKITHDEMEAGHNKIRESGTTHLDRRFNAADANHDGELDRTEAESMPMLAMYFDEVDANKDGKVTRQEYLEAMPLLHRGKTMGPAEKRESL